MVAMGGIGGPVRIGVMRGHDPYSTPGFGDPVQLRNEGHHVRYVLYHVAADDFVKLVVGERIGYDAEVVDDIGISPRIVIDPDGSGIFVASTADVEDLVSRTLDMIDLPSWLTHGVLRSGTAVKKEAEL